MVRANQCFGGSWAGGSLPVLLRSSVSSATKSLYRLLTDHERVGVDTAVRSVFVRLAPLVRFRGTA